MIVRCSCLTLHLSEKLIHPEPALLTHEFDHELDVVLQGMDGRIERATEYARVPTVVDDEWFGVAAELPCSRVEEPDAFFRCQDGQPDRSMVEVLTAGGDERVGSSADRLVRGFAALS